MKHRMNIRVSREPPGMALMRCRRVAIRERFLRWLFGEKRSVTVIVLGDTVETVSIEELPVKGGDAYDCAEPSG